MFYNPVLIGGAVAWFMAQFIKVLLNLIKFRRFDMERIFGSGGSLVLIHRQFVPPQLLFVDYTDQIRLFSGLWL